jgi:hypothetical protein
MCMSWPTSSHSKENFSLTVSYFLTYPHQRLPSLSPQQYLDALMRNRGYPVTPIKSLETAFYNKPSTLQKASYHIYLIEAAKEDPIIFRRLLEAGLSPNPCNTHSESLLHTVCRRALNASLRVLIDCGTELRVCDDYGRTPLHDAMWCSEPAPATVDTIMRHTETSWYLFHMLDSRGSTPLGYIRREHWAEWIQYLEARKDEYWPKVKHHQPAPDHPAIVKDAAHSRPRPDPEHALSPELATMVASGKMTPAEVAIMMLEEEDSDDDESFDEADSDYDSEDDDSDFDSRYDSDNMSIDEESVQGLIHNLAPPRAVESDHSSVSTMAEFGDVLKSLSSKGARTPMAWCK